MNKKFAKMENISKASNLSAMRTNKIQRKKNRYRSEHFKSDLDPVYKKMNCSIYIFFPKVQYSIVYQL